MPPLTDAAKEAVGFVYRTEGRELNATLLNAVLIGVNEVEERAKIAARVSWEPWDWVSPINGVSAEEIRARPDVLPGQAYLIVVDGAPRIFQPHAPGVAGLAPIESEAAMRAAAEQQMRELIDGLTIQHIAGVAVQRLAALEADQAALGLEQQQQRVDAQPGVRRAQGTRRP